MNKLKSTISTIIGTLVIVILFAGMVYLMNLRNGNDLLNITNTDKDNKIHFIDSITINNIHYQVISYDDEEFIYCNSVLVQIKKRNHAGSN